MRRSLVLIALSMTTGGCSRAPAEPAPAATTAEGATSTPAHAPVPSTAAPAPGPPASARRLGCVAPLASVAPAVPPPAGAACPIDPEMGGPKLPIVDVDFPETGGAVHVAAELARTGHDIERGLMYRRSMPDDRGMLFRLGERRVHTFWMHNTCIPLDMMFVDEDGTIVGVVESAPTLDDSTRSVPCASRWVLEVNAGWTRKHGVRPGQRMAIPDQAR